MRKKKILYVVHGHPNLAAGGAETHTFEIFEEMKARGSFQPLLLARVGPPNSCKPGVRLSQAEGDPTQHFLYTEFHEIDYFNLSARAKRIATSDYRKFLEMHRPDVVHFQHTLHLGFELLRETRNVLPKAPIVYTLHEFLPICANNGQMIRVRSGERCSHASPLRCHDCFPERSTGDFFLRQRFIQSHLGLVDLFLAPSQFLREKYIDWGIPAEKIRFQDYGRPRVRPLPEVLRERNSIGFFGQFNPYKGIDVLLRAMLILGKERKNAARLWVHGANLEYQPEPFRQEFHRLVAAASANTTLVGRYSRDEVSRLMSHVDWVVVPSVWWENSPLVIQEAFLHRRPVICSNIGGMAEKVLDGVNGLHFRAGDAFSLAEAIRRATTTENLWETLVAGIPEIYRVENAVEDVSQMYVNLLAEKSNGALAAPAATRAAVAGGVTAKPNGVSFPIISNQDRGRSATLEALEPAALEALK